MRHQIENRIRYRIGQNVWERRGFDVESTSSALAVCANQAGYGISAQKIVKNGNIPTCFINQKPGEADEAGKCQEAGNGGFLKAIKSMSMRQINQKAENGMARLSYISDVGMQCANGSNMITNWQAARWRNWDRNIETSGNFRISIQNRSRPCGASIGVERILETRDCRKYQNSLKIKLASWWTLRVRRRGSEILEPSN